MKKSIVALAVLGMTVTGAAGVYAAANTHKGAAPKLASKPPVVQTGTSRPAVQSLVSVKYSDAQIKEIRKAFAQFESFETAYAPKSMKKGDAYQKAVATGDGVNLVFNRMTVNVSPRDYSFEYDGKTVKLSNGTSAKWYTPDKTPMLTFKLNDRFVTISSPNGKVSKADMEKIAVSVDKVSHSAVQSLATMKYSDAQIKEIKKAFAGFESFETAYAPKSMKKGDAYQKVVATGDGVNLVFDHTTVNVSPRDYAYEYEGKTVKLSNGTSAKWYTPDQTPMLTFKLDDRFVTISSPDGKVSKADMEKIAVSVAKLS
ncbi:hypothetical protein [Cohnella nanjingensis]|uniref:DUF2092 domain-containing protein n=1 Tax=Cohnella nanjingensis TaxID=1387779 RepID=A0A7X0VFT3_9BACL|nr:hypothetical protein [Cohnella nanjingensis]MBB6672385.1 hypothetical protein [Cohnella nanjingensis]